MQSYLQPINALQAPLAQGRCPMMETQTARRGVDDIVGHLHCRRQILFFVWVTLNEQKWVTLAERRGFWA